MKKYAVVILGILLCMCGYLAYRLGGTTCRKEIAEERTEVHRVAEQNGQRIREKVLSINAVDNLDWLRQHWKRAN